MAFNPISSIINYCQNEFPEATRACKTASEKVMNFAEEMTMFFKNRRVKPMPDSQLMMVLHKNKTRKKKRTVTKMEGPNRLWMSKKYPGDDTASDSNEDGYSS